MDSAEELCLSCGMCCDGSLFDNVHLAPEEDSEAYASMELPVKWSRAKVPKAFFRQPCRALCDDMTCRVYSERPSQCRRFECGVFKACSLGALSYEKAARLVGRAKSKAKKVRRLLREMDCPEEALSIGARFRRIQRRLNAGKIDADQAEVFADLGLAVHQLDLLAHQYFYTEEE